jgi:hypothetical protein
VGGLDISGHGQQIISDTAADEECRHNENGRDWSLDKWGGKIHSDACVPTGESLSFLSALGNLGCDSYRGSGLQSELSSGNDPFACFEAAAD